MCFRHSKVGYDEAGTVDKYNVTTAYDVRLVVLGFTGSGRDLKIENDEFEIETFFTFWITFWIWLRWGLNIKHIQIFEWLKVVWMLNGSDFKWHSKNLTTSYHSKSDQITAILDSFALVPFLKEQDYVLL